MFLDILRKQYWSYKYDRLDNILLVLFYRHGHKKVNKLYNIVVSSNIFHLQPELCKSVHKCNFGEFLNFRNFWTNDVTDDVIGVVGSIFWVILRVYIYDVIISKFHQNRSVNKNSTGGVKITPPWYTSVGSEKRYRKSSPPHTPREHNYCGLTAWPICMIFFSKCREMNLVQV